MLLKNKKDCSQWIGSQIEKQNKTIYKQLTEYLEIGIANGTFPPDKPLPSH